MKKAVIILAIAGLLTYAGVTIYKQSQLIKNIDYTFSNKKFRIISANELQVSFDINVVNKSAIAFSIISYSVDIYIDSAKIGTATNEKSIHIDRSATSAIPVNVQFNTTDVLGYTINTSIGDIAESNIHTVGYFIVNNKIFLARIPIDISFKLRDMIGSVITTFSDILSSVLK